MKTLKEYLLEEKNEFSNKELDKLVKKYNLVLDKTENNTFYYKSNDNFNICKNNLIFKKEDNVYHKSGYITDLCSAKVGLIYKNTDIIKKQHVKIDPIRTNEKTEGYIILRYKGNGLGRFGIIKENDEYKIYFTFTSSEKWAQNYLIKIAEYLLTNEIKREDYYNS